MSCLVSSRLLKGGRTKTNPTQSNTTQYNTTQYNTIQSNKAQHKHPPLPTYPEKISKPACQPSAPTPSKAVHHAREITAPLSPFPGDPQDPRPESPCYTRRAFHTCQSVTSPLPVIDIAIAVAAARACSTPSLACCAKVCCVTVRCSGLWGLGSGLRSIRVEWRGRERSAVQWSRRVWCVVGYAVLPGVKGAVWLGGTKR